MNTQSRKTKSSEEQIPQAPAEADFVGLIKYISEREVNLARYSDKLRTSLQRIFDVFGNPDYCQICRTTANSTLHTNIIKGQGQYFGKVYNAGESTHVFKPKKRVSMNVETKDWFADVPLESGDFERYWLCIHDGELKIRGSCRDEQDETGFVSWYVYPDESVREANQASRELLKHLVRSGALPKFLALVAQKLSEAEAEYGEVATIAEKMAKAIG